MANYTEEELKHWWVAKCPECRWEGLSRDAEGGRAIADTGDYDDVICPVCIHNEDGKWRGDFVVVEEVTNYHGEEHTGDVPLRRPDCVSEE
jgi:hypothetical protein